MTSIHRLWLGAALAGAAACSVPASSSRRGDARRVVFVCEHGAAKSVVAAAHFNRLARDRGLPYLAVARGADPQEKLAPSAVKGLAAEGIEALPANPERVTAGDLRGASRVIAFDCDLTSVTPPGTPIESWDEVPAVGDDYGVARNMIVDRLGKLLDELTRARR